MNILSNFHNVSELIVKSVYCNGLKWFSHWSLKNRLEQTCFLMKLLSSFSFPLLLPWLYRSREMEGSKMKASKELLFFVDNHLFQRIVPYRTKSSNNNIMISISFNSSIWFELSFTSLVFSRTKLRPASNLMSAVPSMLRWLPGKHSCESCNLAKIEWISVLKIYKLISYSASCST